MPIANRMDMIFRAEAIKIGSSVVACILLSFLVVNIAGAAPKVPKTIRLSRSQIVARAGPKGRVLCARIRRTPIPVAVGRVKKGLYERLHERKLFHLRKTLSSTGAAGRRVLKKRAAALRARRSAADRICNQGFEGLPLEPLEIDNTKSGISISLSGRRGVDWAVEHTFHDITNGDQIIFIRSDVDVSLAHNEHNSLIKRDTSLPAVLGVAGPDGVPNSGDEGDIHYKVDRDMQAHRYSTKGTSEIPSFSPLYTQPLRFDRLSYDGSRPVLGSVGDNNGPWGSEASNTTERFAYGQRDQSGNECHTLTYWDDDEPLFRAVHEDSHRQGASDGHWVLFCVNPATPVIQLHAPQGEQYYTTPLKTYHIPKLWEQTSYMTEGVEIGLLNLSSRDPVYFRVDGGECTRSGSRNLIARRIFMKRNEPSLFEARIGPRGPVLRRLVVVGPDYPGADEDHGRLLWGSEEARQVIVTKVHQVQPFARAYADYLGSWYQGATQTFGPAREEWRAAASSAGLALANAFGVAIDGAEERAGSAALGKERLLRLARLEPVGNECDINSATPAKDYMNELGQTIQGFADAGVAYDLFARYFRASEHAGGMTPIEELRIRDGLAEIAKTTLQHRDNYGFIHGGGDSHWPLGYEITLATIALAMPGYKTPYFGVSGGDFETQNNLAGPDGRYWNPFPDQGISWYQAATDPDAPIPGYPNNAKPPRAEFLYTDEGYWVGANDLQGDGDRYVTGPLGSRLVDVTYGGLANAENRVELVEMAGYESPFTVMEHALEFMRRLKGDPSPRHSVSAYIERRLIGGYTPLSWNANLKRYEKEPLRIAASLLAFNALFPSSALPQAQAAANEYLHNVLRYYRYEAGSYPSYIEDDRKTLSSAYTLALFENPGDIRYAYSGSNRPPIIKPAFKYVVKPGETIFKELIITDPDGDDTGVSVEALPSGANYDSVSRIITWTPGVEDAGVHLMYIHASDGKSQTARPFPIIVKADAGSGPVPSAPSDLSASVSSSRLASLRWSAPEGMGPAYYAIYRDGALRDVVPGSQLSYLDTVELPAGSHTRYSVSAYAPGGAESYAAAAPYVTVSK